jgi:hypothetical protein
MRGGKESMKKTVEGFRNAIDCNYACHDDSSCIKDCEARQNDDD